MACRKSLNIRIRANSQTIFNFLCSQDNILGRYRIKSVDNQRLVIFLKNGVNWRSWGENITIEVEHETNETAKIIISSESAVSTTLIDWGQNQKNIEKIAHYIHSVFPCI